MKTNQQHPRQQAAAASDFNRFFSVQQVDKSFKQVIAKRRAPIRPFKGITNYDANEMKKRAFMEWGLDEYVDCWTFEMASRPIPFVSTDTRPLRVLEKFEQYIEAVLSVIVPRMEPHTQTYNKVSRLGYPVLTNPEDEAGNLIKMDVIREKFAPLEDGDSSEYKDSFSTIGIRLQNEPPSKLRTFQFITSEGRIYEKEIDRRDYSRTFEQLGEVVPSRTRTVVNPAMINLYLQNWDTMLHRAIMKFPLCEANVYTKEIWTSDADFESFDCKHYERCLGMVVFAYARAIGGQYGVWLDKLARDPYLVPSDDWKTEWLVEPQFSNSVFPQFGSGLCCVSTLGKLANICVQVGYFVEHYGLSKVQAVQATLDGAYDGLRRWMYGDDNRTKGEKQKRRAFISTWASTS